jgi:hypothetical protein
MVGLHLADADDEVAEGLACYVRGARALGVTLGEVGNLLGPIDKRQLVIQLRQNRMRLAERVQLYRQYRGAIDQAVSEVI